MKFRLSLFLSVAIAVPAAIRAAFTPGATMPLSSPRKSNFADQDSVFGGAAAGSTATPPISWEVQHMMERRMKEKRIRNANSQQQTQPGSGTTDNEQVQGLPSRTLLPLTSHKPHSPHQKGGKVRGPTTVSDTGDGGVFADQQIGSKSWEPNRMERVQASRQKTKEQEEKLEAEWKQTFEDGLNGRRQRLGQFFDAYDTVFEANRRPSWIPPPSTTTVVENFDPTSQSQSRPPSPQEQEQGVIDTTATATSYLDEPPPTRDHVDDSTNVHPQEQRNVNTIDDGWFSSSNGDTGQVVEQQSPAMPPPPQNINMYDSDGWANAPPTSRSQASEQQEYQNDFHQQHDPATMATPQQSSNEEAQYYYEAAQAAAAAAAAQEEPAFYWDYYQYNEKDDPQQQQQRPPPPTRIRDFDNDEPTSLFTNEEEYKDDTTGKTYFRYSKNTKTQMIQEDPVYPTYNSPPSASWNKQQQQQQQQQQRRPQPQNGPRRPQPQRQGFRSGGAFPEGEYATSSAGYYRDYELRNYDDFSPPQDARGVQVPPRQQQQQQQHRPASTDSVRFPAVGDQSSYRRPPMDPKGLFQSPAERRRRRQDQRGGQAGGGGRPGEDDDFFRPPPRSRRSMMRRPPPPPPPSWNENAPYPPPPGFVVYRDGNPSSRRREAVPPPPQRQEDLYRRGYGERPPPVPIDPYDHHYVNYVDTHPKQQRGSGLEIYGSLFTGRKRDPRGNQVTEIPEERDVK